MAIATVALNGALAALLAIPGLRYLAHPLLRSRTASTWQRVAALTALSPGRPTRVNVIRASRDAFTAYPPGPIGSVWLLRTEGADGGGPTVTCWQAMCPHLGCGIDYTAERGAFACPCHASEFDATGARKHGPSPRDMDALETRISEADAQGTHWVEVNYQVFRTGRASKELA